MKKVKSSILMVPPSPYPNVYTVRLAIKGRIYGNMSGIYADGCMCAVVPRVTEKNFLFNQQLWNSIKLG